MSQPNKRVFIGKCQYCEAPIFTDMVWPYPTDKPLYYSCECRNGRASPPYAPHIKINSQEHVRESINSQAPLAETKEQFDVPKEEIRHGEDNSGGNLSKEPITSESVEARKEQIKE